MKRKYKCIICGIEVKPLNIVDVDVEDHERMIDKGIVFRLTMGYGSDLDGDMFTCALCDECIKLMRSSNIIRHDGNYILKNSEL